MLPSDRRLLSGCCRWGSLWLWLSGSLQPVMRGGELVGDKGATGTGGQEQDPGGSRPACLDRLWVGCRKVRVQKVLLSPLGEPRAERTSSHSSLPELCGPGRSEASLGLGSLLGFRDRFDPQPRPPSIAERLKGQASPFPRDSGAFLASSPGDTGFARGCPTPPCPCAGPHSALSSLLHRCGPPLASPPPFPADDPRTN